MTRVSTTEAGALAGYRHEALFYAGSDEFMAGTLPFIREAVAREEPILVVLGATKIKALRAALDGDGDRVLFADMSEVGTNPARIIPAWREFLAEKAIAGRPVRGIGEPVWCGRSRDELDECERHEALLNIAFADPDFWLLCPYDTASLAPSVLEEALRNHPFVRRGRESSASDDFPGAATFGRPYDRPLPDAPAGAAVLRFSIGGLDKLRRFVSVAAGAAGLSEARTAELVLAVNEVATNSLVHGGGEGTLRSWRTPGGFVCEVSDHGQITEPLAGRVLPGALDETGRGLWLANQFCELVQLRSTPTGTTVRMHVRVA